ncbi:yippee-domain-containing protein [Colletotrichum somersetense]|nr:yippee-domain-containing protein [Colletotrichum somersetense]
MAPSIVVSRPTFPTYLLPSFNIPFRRRAPPPAASASTAAAAAVGSPSAATAKSARPRTGRPSLARIQPDTLRCSTCSCDIAFSSQIVSKGFTGRYGRAYLVAPTPPPSAPVSGGAPPPASKIGNNIGPAGPGTLANVRIGKCENRQLVTGWHVVADITCVLCSAKLGWKYVDAKELSQKYKVGKFILEVERVVPFRSWEDAPADGRGILQDDGEEEGEQEVDVVFDSEDEDDLEDLFSGNWDPEVVAKRRSRRVTTARKKS